MSKVVQSSIVTKCAKMVDILALSHRSLSFSELAKRSGLVKSSAHRIVSILISERLASFDEVSKTYSLGSRSLTWAQSFLRRSNLPNIADRYFDDFCQRNEMNGALSVLDSGDVLYLRTYDPIPIKSSSFAGDRAPIHCTAAGKIQLAYSSNDRRNEILDNLNFQAFTEFTIKEREAFEAELTISHEQGFAVAIQEEFFQVLGIGAPVLDEQGQILAAITMWSHIDRISPEKLRGFAQPLMDMAAHMSKEHLLGKV